MKTDNSDIFKPEFVSSLPESMASGVFTLNGEGVITSWNPAMKQIFLSLKAASRIDATIIIQGESGTGKELFNLVRNGNFREDLYYRLKVFPINIPPLRKRREDIPLLLSHLIKIQSDKSGKQTEGVSTQARRIIMDCSWPDSVRELENAIEHAFVLCAEKQIDIFDLPVEIGQVEYHLASQNTASARGSYSNFKQKLTRGKLLDHAAPLRTGGIHDGRGSREHKPNATAHSSDRTGLTHSMGMTTISFSSILQDLRKTATTVPING